MSEAAPTAPISLENLEATHKMLDRCMAIMTTVEISIVRAGEAWEALLFLKGMRDETKKKIDALKPKTTEKFEIK